MKQFIAIFALLLLLPVSGLAEEELTDEQILKRIFDRVDKNEKRIDQFGFYQETLNRELKKDGSIEQEEKKIFRTTWIGDQRYGELIEINGKSLTAAQKKEEQKRRQKFLKETKGKRMEIKKDVEIAWKGLYDRFDFVRKPAEQGAFYVYSFQPKKKKLSERNRMEKVLNHMDGTLRADENFNLLWVRAILKESIKFGLGLLAKLDTLELEYKLQEHETVWLPASIRFKFDARVALVHRERQESVNRFYDIFPRPGSVPPPAPTGSSEQ